MHSLSSFLAEEFDIMKLIFHGTSFWGKIDRVFKKKVTEEHWIEIGSCPTQLPTRYIGGAHLGPFLHCHSPTWQSRRLAQISRII